MISAPEMLYCISVLCVATLCIGWLTKGRDRRRLARLWNLTSMRRYVMRKNHKSAMLRLMQAHGQSRNAYRLAADASAKAVEKSHGQHIVRLCEGNAESEKRFDECLNRFRTYEMSHERLERRFRIVVYFAEAVMFQPNDEALWIDWFASEVGRGISTELRTMNAATIHDYMNEFERRKFQDQPPGPNANQMFRVGRDGGPGRVF